MLGHVVADTRLHAWLIQVEYRQLSECRRAYEHGVFGRRLLNDLLSVFDKILSGELMIETVLSHVTKVGLVFLTCRMDTDAEFVTEKISGLIEYAILFHRKAEFSRTYEHPYYSKLSTPTPFRARSYLHHELWGTTTVTMSSAPMNAGFLLAASVTT